MGRRRDPRGRRARRGRAVLGPARPLPPAGRDRRRARRGAARRGHRLARDPRALRAARAGGAEPDGDAQPRGRARDGARSAGRARAARARSTPTIASAATTACSRSARTCWTWPASASRRGRRISRPRAVRRACPSGATSSSAPPAPCARLADAARRIRVHSAQCTACRVSARRRPSRTPRRWRCRRPRRRSRPAGRHRRRRPPC